MARGRGGRGLAALCVVALTSALVACDGGGDADDPAPTASPTDPSSAPSGSGTPGGPVELTIACHGYDAVDAAFDQNVELF